MGSFLSGALGTENKYQASQYQAGNVYDPEVLKQQLRERDQLYGQQQGLAGQLQQQAAGEGPNPAQIQYQQNVNQNIANTQGLISSQRGLNPALAARMGANAGALANQQAASESALQQQRQQVAAQQSLGGLYGQMQQGNLNQQQLYGAQNIAAMQTNAAIAKANQDAASGIVGGLMGGGGSAATMAKHKGGMIDHYADGGVIDVAAGAPEDQAAPQGSNNVSRAGMFLQGMGSGIGAGATSADAALTQGFGPVGGTGRTHGALSYGFSTPYRAARAASGGPSGGMAHGGPVDFRSGGHVPGQAAVSGDSIKNDTVPAMVSPGEIVIPRSVVNANNAPDKAKAFVAAILAKKGLRSK